MYRIALASCLLFFASPSSGQSPAAEERIPPLVVPEGFKSTLFAADPLVEYPSVIALGPQPRTLFVAHDYMTGLGTEIVRRDEIRLLRDRDGDGAADESILYAEGFNSIQGLAFYAGAVYAMHAPLLTALKDTDGDGKADERRDLLSGLGLQPEQNPTRLHCANGVTIGHDGWLYLALGDNGVDVPRPEGDRLVLQGGGILRCRPDGRDLHVFSTGLRNIYDIALDAELNVFVRDNENDGGDYMIRVCHSFHGADHGYPYHYYERPKEALAPIADLGRGSSAGGVCYLETAFPSPLRGSLVFCEWGRAVVRYDRQASGSGFGKTAEVDLASGAANDPYGFKPTDLVVDRDGSLVISDWCDGQRPKRGRGRIYRITYGERAESPRAPLPSTERALAQLDSRSYHARVEAQEFLERSPQGAADAVLAALRANQLGPRARLHAVWMLVKANGEKHIDDLFPLARADSDPAVRSQAIRALADLTDPMLREHRLDAGPADAALGARFAALAKDQPPSVLREIIVALGRLRWAQAPRWLQEQCSVLSTQYSVLDQPDAALAHAAMQTLRRSDNWPEVLALLDLPDQHTLRAIALRAVADRAEPTIADGLIERLRRDDNPSRRGEYADALTRIYKLPAAWKYWGYRPAPRPANSVEWERTAAIEESIDRVLRDPDHDVRLATLRRIQREQVPTRLPTLADWLREERGKEHVAEILRALAGHPPRATLELWEEVVRQRSHDVDNRLAAVRLLVTSKEPWQERWLDLLTSLEDGPVMAALLSGDVRLPPSHHEVLLAKLDSPSPLVREAAIASLARRNVPEAALRVPGLLDDVDQAVRRTAAAAAGKLRAADCARKLIELGRGPDLELRSICLDSLRQLGDPQAMPLATAALDQAPTQRAALDYLADWGSAEQAEAVEKLAHQSRSHEIVASAVAALANWESNASRDSDVSRRLQETIAQVQGASGVVLHWQVPDSDRPWRWLADRSDAEGRIELIGTGEPPTDRVWSAISEVHVLEQTRVEFLAAGSGPMQVLLNGESIHDGKAPTKYQADSLRFTAQLEPGRNSLLVRLSPSENRVHFHLRFRRIGSSAEHERLARHLLSGTGNPDRGREVFQAAEKSLCVKCHRLGEQGGKIGPDLSGVGRRFSRVHLIESILEPSRAIAPSFETIVVALTDGRIVSGVKLSEDDRTLTLGDDQGRTHEIAKKDIDERQSQTKSTMPDGLEKRLSDRELLDLLTFLLAQKNRESQR